jgi:hypothetical protein
MSLFRYAAPSHSTNISSRCELENPLYPKKSRRSIIPLKRALAAEMNYQKCSLHRLFWLLHFSAKIIKFV